MNSLILGKEVFRMFHEWEYSFGEYWFVFGKEDFSLGFAKKENDLCKGVIGISRLRDFDINFDEDFTFKKFVKVFNIMKENLL